jgi:vacuolar-type H+-ATPase subunit H
MSGELTKNEALEALQKIKQAEAEARKIIHDARENTSVKIIQDAYDEAEQIKKRVLDEARKDAHQKKEAIIREAQDKVQRINDQTQAEIEHLREKSATVRDEVVAKVAASIRKTIEGGRL